MRGGFLILEEEAHLLSADEMTESSSGGPCAINTWLWKSGKLMLRVRKVMPLRAIPEDLNLIVSWSCTGITLGRYLASGSVGSGSGPSQGSHESRSSYTTNSRTLGGCTNRTTASHQGLSGVSQSSWSDSSLRQSTCACRSTSRAGKNPAYRCDRCARLRNLTTAP